MGDSDTPYAPVTRQASGYNMTSASGYGGQGYTYAFTDNPADVTCSGPLTATFTWSGGTSAVPPPAGVLIQENCLVEWSVEDATVGSGSCTTSFGGANETAGGGYGYRSVTGVRYTYIADPGASFSLPRSGSPSISPSASASAATPTDCSVSAALAYTATAYPVNIQLTGTTSNGYGDQYILIGQHCSASVTGLPSFPSGTQVTYQWSVSGTTFQTWHPTTPAIGNTQANPNASYYVNGRGPLTNPTAAWYWNDFSETTETVSCIVSVTLPTGQSFSVTPTQAVDVMVPSVQATWTGGYIEVGEVGNNAAQWELGAQPTDPTNPSGQGWYATVTTPQGPPFGRGQIEMVQIAIPNRSYVAFATGLTHNDPENNQVGLDTGYPLGGKVVPEPYPYTNNDFTVMQLQNGQPIASQAQMGDQFQDTLMYQPPNGVWVPVAIGGWSVNGGATIPGTNNWADYVSPVGQSLKNWAGTVSPPSQTFTPSNFFPLWGVIDHFPAF